MKTIITISTLLFAINTNAQTPVTSVPAPTPGATPGFEWSGDLRIRLNQFSEADDDQHRNQQLRARLNLKADVNPTMKAYVRLATGTTPTSANQTLGDSSAPGMQRRNFGLDQAFVDWTFADQAHLWAGRTANPFWSPNKVQTIFDADATFEGLVLKWDPQWSDSAAFVSAGAFMLSENYSAPDDSVDQGLVALDLGYRGERDGLSFAVHTGTYHFLNVQDQRINRLESGTLSNDTYSEPFLTRRGNTIYELAADEFYYKNQYALFDLGGEVRMKVSGGNEVGAFYEYVKNYAVGELGHAHEFGIIGKWRGIGLSLARIDKDSDSVLAVFTDSDTSGGGTDTEGYRLQISYQFAQNASVLASQFEADRGVDTVKRDYSGSQVDISFNF